MKLSLPKKLVDVLAEKNAQIVSLRISFLLQSIIIIGLIATIYKAPDKITVYVPPDLSNGAVMQIGDVPNANVLSTVSYLWIEVNSWLKNGEKDAFQNLDAYREYFSEDFREQLFRSYKSLKAKGELDRVRKVTLVPGMIHEVEKRVFERVKNKAWVVYLDIIVEDYYLGELVQHVRARYPLQVERVETNYDRNPLGLIVTGFERKPTIINEVK